MDLVVFCQTAFGLMLHISGKMIELKMTCFVIVVDEGMQHGLRNGCRKEYSEGK
jgi:hypothetical protein